MIYVRAYLQSNDKKFHRGTEIEWMDGWTDLIPLDWHVIVETYFLHVHACVDALSVSLDGPIQLATYIAPKQLGWYAEKPNPPQIASEAF